eukprot:COSAG06_NODE_41313_length_392_cov_1.836177_1_plen_23_part_01
MMIQNLQLLDIQLDMQDSSHTDP